MPSVVVVVSDSDDDDSAIIRRRMGTSKSRSFNDLKKPGGALTNANPRSRNPPSESSKSRAYLDLTNDSDDQTHDRNTQQQVSGNRLHSDPKQTVIQTIGRFGVRKAPLVSRTTTSRKPIPGDAEVLEILSDDELAKKARDVVLSTSSALDEQGRRQQILTPGVPNLPEVCSTPQSHRLKRQRDSTASTPQLTAPNKRSKLDKKTLGGPNRRLPGSPQSLDVQGGKENQQSVEGKSSAVYPPGQMTQEIARRPALCSPGQIDKTSQPDPADVQIPDGSSPVPRRVGSRARLNSPTTLSTPLPSRTSPVATAPVAADPHVTSTSKNVTRNDTSLVADTLDGGTNAGCTSVEQDKTHVELKAGRTGSVARVNVGDCLPSLSSPPQTRQGALQHALRNTSTLSDDNGRLTISAVRTTEAEPSEADASRDGTAHDTFHSAAKLKTPAAGGRNDLSIVRESGGADENSAQHGGSKTLHPAPARPPVPDAVLKGAQTALVARVTPDGRGPVVTRSSLRPTEAGVKTSLAHDVIRILTKYLQESREEAHYWNRVLLGRAQASKQIDGPVSRHKAVSFANLKPIDMTQAPQSVDEGVSVQVLVDPAPRTKKSVIQHVDVPVTLLDAPTVNDVPDYVYYVPIRRSFLAANEKVLPAMPYFGDNPDVDEAGLREQYAVDNVERRRKLQRLLQAQELQEFVESAMEEARCGWEDVLRVLLDPNPVMTTDLDAKSAMGSRATWYDEDHLTSMNRVMEIVGRLSPQDGTKNATAAVLCSVFHQLAGFSLWHIARKNKLVDPKQEPGEEDSLEKRICRVCFSECCNQHGEIQEVDISDCEGSVEEALLTDVVHPLDVNLRKRVNIVETAPDTEEDALRAEVSTRKDPRKHFYWERKYETRTAKRKPFYPCFHPGSTCADAQCSCVRNRVMCEKSCGCSQSCPRRFRGCSCKATNKKASMVCFNDERCVCHTLERECDPDLCGSCGVREVADPQNKHNDAVTIGRCNNASIQRGRSKHTIQGDSLIHGLGLYACEDVKKWEFVGEYKGEIVTEQECDRRGAIYDRIRLSYMFELNADQVFDPTYYGNKIRYMNSISAKEANCKPYLLLVNTVHRIGLFATRPIRAGDELLFDYGIKFWKGNDQSSNKRKSAVVATRKKKEMEKFYDVQVEEDGEGHRVIKKAPGVGLSANQKATKDKGAGTNGATAGTSNSTRTLAKSAVEINTGTNAATADDELHTSDQAVVSPYFSNTESDGMIAARAEAMEEDDDDFALDVVESSSEVWGGDGADDGGGFEADNDFGVENPTSSRRTRGRLGGGTGLQTGQARSRPRR